MNLKSEWMQSKTSLDSLNGGVTLLKRKILSAIFSSLLFAFIFSYSDFEMNGFLNLYYLNFIFVITYGLLASIVSDWLGKKVFPTLTYGREMFSLVLHCLFGLVFFLLSLVSAIIFFIVDRSLRKVEIKWWMVIVSLSVVLIVFIINVI